MSQTVISRGLTLADDWYGEAEKWVFEDKRALRGLAMARVLSGCAVLGLLITNFRVRDLMFGQASVWNKPIAELTQFAPTRLTANLGNTAFLFFYLAVMLLSLLWILGWHTRLVGPLMLIGEVAIIERNPVLGDQGDNILRIGLILLMFMHTNEFWSLDARRRERTSPAPMGRSLGFSNVVGLFRNLRNSQYVIPRWFSNGAHNVALCMLAFQLIIIYTSSGMFKTQGAFWQHGTALYYPMQLQEYKPFPFLTDLFTHFGVIIGISTYVVVFTQLFFPLMLLRVITRRIAIALVLLFHLAIAVLMALPWFSLSMLAFDAIWVSTGTLVALDGWLRGRLVPFQGFLRDLADPIVDRVAGRARGLSRAGMALINNLETSQYCEATEAYARLRPIEVLRARADRSVTGPVYGLVVDFAGPGPVGPWSCGGSVWQRQAQGYDLGGDLGSVTFGCRGPDTTGGSACHTTPPSLK